MIWKKTVFYYVYGGNIKLYTIIQEQHSQWAKIIIPAKYEYPKIDMPIIALEFFVQELT